MPLVTFRGFLHVLRTTCPYLLDVKKGRTNDACLHPPHDRLQNIAGELARRRRARKPYTAQQTLLFYPGGLTLSCPHFRPSCNSSSIAFRNANGRMVVSASRMMARKTVERLIVRPISSDCSCAKRSSVAMSAWVNVTPTLLSGAGIVGAVAFFRAGRVVGFIVSCYLTSGGETSGPILL